MVFAYFKRLTPEQQAVYLESDRIGAVRLPRAKELRAMVGELEQALEAQDRPRIQALTQALANGMVQRLKVPPIRIKVMAVRPSNESFELHGFYEPAEGRKRARITLWMRTAQRRQVVAFRTFLRTLLHELGHHLDYELLGLSESFHTEGFYKRESSLFHQLVPKKAPARP